MSRRETILDLASRLLSVVDAVNSYCVRSVKVEKHTPLSNMEQIQAFPIGQASDVTLACLFLMRQGSRI